MIDFDRFPSPCYIMDEELLRKNLTLIKSVADRAGVEIILAFKSFAMWRSFPIFREYVEHSTASSVYEARLALEEFGSKAHTYSPAYTEADFPEIMRCSSHITFNSLSQFCRFYPAVVKEGSGISCGIRINPEYSEVETELYLSLIHISEHLIHLLNDLRSRHPHLRIILEPGSAFTWQTGVLTSEVVDIVESRGIRTAILNVSFTCHMPDCLEMPYQPAVCGAEMGNNGCHVYRLGGNSCLSGDYMGDWSFDHELQIGERIVFEDMIHYTMVKTNMFNGIHHPAIAMWTKDGKAEIFRQFSYEDYRDRMS